ncbi:hypothetical protein Acid345_1917 [Candidatus Koribacter versatilis Ellin345]|uniref:Uncharacterized protein n=1 Tax=Koribacter versatilis (strain Ellin345) TaxID=204669 RepID=Q1IQD2_KORVE|nr:hypothetical protein [Candidatus Koribacter versatilis]ABF40918.1 hypothetical protein Acid345_1917 [Candidatus Koribacter versatilis Ellin345]
MNLRAFIVSTALLFTFLPAHTQEPATEPDPQFTAQRGSPSTWSQDQLRKMQKAQTVERQKKLKEDTDKLLSLATELKDSVDKTNQNVLSLEVIRKAEEIEKLAKKIKTNMRDEIR